MTTAHLVLGDGAVAALDNVLLYVMKVDGRWQFPPLSTVWSSALHPDWQILVYQEHLRARGNSVPRFLFPHIAPLLKELMTGLVAGGKDKERVNVGEQTVGTVSAYFL